MPSWLLLAIAAQFLTALSVVIDRHIVVKARHIGKPVVYAFYVSVLSFFVIVLVPFGVTVPSVSLLFLAAIHAALFITAIFYLYSALTEARASDAAPVVGALSAITTLLVAHLLIDGDVSRSFVVPVLLLAVGTALISHFHFTRRAVLCTLVSGIAFGGVAISAKLVFLETTFVDGFFWTRMFGVLGGLALLLVPAFRHAIFSGGTQSTQGAKFLVLGNKVLGGSAAVLTAFAISMGSVSVVNALSGLQFAFLYLFALLFAPYMPVLKEGSKTHGHGGWQTGLGVAVITTGLALLYINNGA